MARDEQALRRGPAEESRGGAPIRSAGAGPVFGPLGGSPMIYWKVQERHR